jgi:hypothetical protein
MTEFSVKTTLPDDIDREEARDVLDQALQREAKLATAKYAYFQRRCQAFEATFDMDSDAFMQQFESGALGDDAEYFDWYATKRGRDLWARRASILAGAQR